MTNSCTENNPHFGTTRYLRKFFGLIMFRLVSVSLTTFLTTSAYLVTKSNTITKNVKTKSRLFSIFEQHLCFTFK